MSMQNYEKLLGSKPASSGTVADDITIYKKKTSVFRIRKFLGLPGRILLLSSKKGKKNLSFHFFVTSLRLFIFEE
jgi:hypothetical protein